MKCKNGCLAKDTKVLMADGSEKIISRIEIGDLVKGYNGKSLKVINTVQGMEECLIEIKTSDGKHLRLTDSHPILKNNIWDRPKRLIADDFIQTKDGISQVNAVYYVTYGDVVYNLALEPQDNYQDGGFFANGIIVGDIVRQYEHLESDNSTKETSSMSEPR